MWIHPAGILLLGSALIPVLKGRIREGYVLLLPFLAFMSVLSMDEGTYGVVNLLGQELIFGRVDKLSLAFAYVFTLMAFIGAWYGLKVKEAGHQVAGFIYAGSATGVAFAGDYFTLFVFWEFMAFSSVFLILYRRTKESYDAAYRYVLVHAFSGVCVLGGIVLQYNYTGSFEFNHVGFGGLASTLLLLGFIINAAVPPFGAWLPDAYPRATVAGAVFMSAFTTKSAVYVLARGFAGTELLVWLGAIMTVYGVMYAMLENDIRRLLSYHIISQVGYMVAGCGIGTELGINGAVAHAFAHILYKGLLFMGAGTVLFITGRSKLTELGGLYRTMPWTFLFFMVGAFAISSVPLLSGFVSKSIILSAAGEEHMAIPWLLMTLASSGTFLSIALKLAYFTFLSEDRGIKAQDPPLNMLIGMGIASFMCILIGVYPKVLYDLLPYSVHYEPYTAEHVVWTCQILLLTLAGFLLYLHKLGGKATISLDTDWFYRMGGRLFMRFAYNVISVVDDAVSGAYNTLILKPSKWLASRCLDFDLGVIDAIVNGVADFVLDLASTMRRVQTGQLQHYAVAVLVGVLVFVNLVFLFS